MVRKIASAVLAVSLMWAGATFAFDLEEQRQAHERRVAWCSQVWDPDILRQMKEKGLCEQSMPWGTQGGPVPFRIETNHPVRFTQEVNTGWIDFSVHQVYQVYLARALGKSAYQIHDHIVLGPPCLIVLVDDTGLNGEIRGKSGLHDPYTGEIFLNVDWNQNHEDMMVTLYHEFIHHYLDKAGVPSEDHHAIMCQEVDRVDKVSPTGFRAQVCDPNIGW